MFENHRSRPAKGRTAAGSDNIGNPSAAAALPPIVAFVGHSGSGKTTFVEKLITRLTRQGVRVAVIKHDVHGFEMDKPGKDTWRHKQAGAVATLISSPGKIGLVMDSDRDHSPEELLPLLHFADLVITEGYKRSQLPKIEVFRPEATGDKMPLRQHDPNLLALITDSETLPADKAIDLPIFGTQDVDAVADFIRARFLAPLDG
jgi:molybdopterin-guanine dinucleotide biosynthesis adapter protein